MVDAPPAPHRRLPVGLGVAVDHEHVQLGGGADVDYGHGLPGTVGARRPDGCVEHPLVERAQPGNVLGDPGNVVHAVEQHWPSFADHSIVLRQP